jgi:hypothetical protein
MAQSPDRPISQRLRRDLQIAVGKFTAGESINAGEALAISAGSLRETVASPYARRQRRQRGLVDV